jgi:hypothetical protein
MAVKSILEVDVKDEAFKAFTDLFKKYETALGQMPATWAKMNKEIAASSNPFKKIDDAAKRTDENLSSAVKRQDALRKQALGSGKAMGGVESSTIKIAKSIKETTLGLAKWAGLGGLFAGGLAGTALLFDRLAVTAGEGRRSAQGLGISTGEHEAEKISYGRIIDVDSLLGRINVMQHDATQAYKFGLAGMASSQYSTDKNASQVLPPLLKSMRQLFLDTKGNRQILEARGALDILSYDELQRLSMFSKEELDGLEKNNSARAKELQLSDDTQRKWQDISDSLSVAKVQIETVLIDGLAKVIPVLAKISNPIIKKVETDLILGAIAVKKFLGPKTKQESSGLIKSASSNKLSAIESQFGLPKGTLSSIEHTESRGKLNSISSKGAKGPFQFMDPTASQYGLQGNDVFDEMKSATAAAKYIRDLLKKYHGDMSKALAAYNEGPGNFDKGRMPAETRNYVAKTLPPIAVNIYNNTGGDMFRTVNGMNPQ